MRNTTQLNPVKLKTIRESKGWSQQKFADHALGTGHSKSTEPSSLLRMYQRIEKTGRTSPERAKRIADVLGFKLADLQNIEHIEQLESAKFIAQKIEERIRYLTDLNDHANLAKIAKLLGWNLHQILSWNLPENNWHYLDTATNLVVEIPRLAFLGRIIEIQEIYDHLKLESHHFQPVTLRASFWWVYSDLGGSQTGYGTLVQNMSAVRQLLDECAKSIRTRFRYTHVTLSLSKEENRDKLEVLVSPSNHRFLFECTPCEVLREKGITWKEPTIWEVGTIRAQMNDIAMNLADIIVIDNAINPPIGSSPLFQITKFYNSNIRDYDHEWDRNKKYEFLNTQPKPNWEKICTQTFSDKFAIADFLNEVLEAKEKSEFEFLKIDAGVELNIMKKISDGIFHFDDLIEKFTIYLGWLNTEGAFEIAPWSESKREQFIELRRPDFELPNLLSIDAHLDSQSAKSLSPTAGESVDEV